ncbi:MAG: amidohydrolase family protein [Clostridia bacterium]
MIIDCHTHIQNKKLANEYFSKGLNVDYAICMNDILRAGDNGMFEYTSISNGSAFYKTIYGDNRLLMCEYIDAFADIEKQLVRLSKMLRVNAKIVGVKIYLGYQPIRADDTRLFPVYQFCLENQLTVVFHTGVGAYFCNFAENDYSSCKYIEIPARLFPKCHFIISHFGFPEITSAARIVTDYPNVYTDISGYFENMSDSDTNAISEYAKLLCDAINGHKNIETKILFGTDFFGNNSSMHCVEEYISVLTKVFNSPQIADIMCQNIISAYPRLALYLQREK